MALETALVIGANGGIGSALVAGLAASGRYDRIIAAARSEPATLPANVDYRPIDIADPASIAAAAARIDAPLTRVIVATGTLHDEAAGPERSLRDLDADRLARLFAINTIGPALVLKHFAPLLAKDQPSTIACISARVGSISDNRLGGWYGYRASKAALNQIVRTAAIELARSRPQAVCVALHPGTVDTGLSKPFQRGVPAEKLFTPAYSAERLLAVLDTLTPAQSGRIFAWDGVEIAP
ncbi:SDR family NAD(P)-dependent oxidoreductase [Sphingomonas sp. 2R-10]|uniref:SDR family NAD(P)-dependent oxidoreductase n=1 Tax=Sphingomonas sp. 2R-10 TaxID=3045148 RepID=UPI000F7663DE|nr:SDR family NAD(P)-dependent oxidoreductase [Sphingomonas sp. 2R-10]MDJ0277197.1 SDR family NAD(P)-dependent oxidoreductase [Sphingomonas sp. 2R-10]